MLHLLAFAVYSNAQGAATLRVSTGDFYKG